MQLHTIDQIRSISSPYLNKPLGQFHAIELGQIPMNHGIVAGGAVTYKTYVHPYITRGDSENP